MVEIIPSINVPTFPEVQERIKRVEPYVTWCHLDVTDGIFSTHPTWRNPEDLTNLDTNLNVEVHLMVQRPEHIIDQWLVSPIKRTIVHIETSRDIDGIIERCHKAGIQIGIAINPDSPWEALKPWIEKADILQILAVSPGPSGQQMKPEIVDKIKHLRTCCLGCIIEADGGVNPETAKPLREAGANLFVVGSAIFSSADIPIAIQVLRDEQTGS